MEKHKCRLCLKHFSNGRALGGHMRSHLPIDSSKQGGEEAELQISNQQQESDDSESASSEEEQELEKGGYYGLRENPKRSIRLVDPHDAGCVVLHDRESETESSKNLTRRRSKRTHHTTTKKLNHIKVRESEGEPVSSISDTTTEEDVAFCLMMLSRDKLWKRKRQFIQQIQEHDEESEEKSMEETDESDDFIKSCKNNSRGKYKCETCKKVFKSYQALGGHRASHKKIKFYTPSQQENAGAGTCSRSMLDKKTHECPVCFRVFSSGQALGGHKRTHVTGLVATTTTIPPRASRQFGVESLIDLNLPAPVDDDDISQIELSAVSDAEFVNHIKP